MGIGYLFYISWGEGCLLGLVGISIGLLDTPSHVARIHRKGKKEALAGNDVLTTRGDDIGSW